MTYYTATGNPGPLTRGASPLVRAEFALIQAGFALLPVPAAISGGYSNYAADTGTANAYSITPATSVTALVDGMTFLVKYGVSNTGASTITLTGVTGGASVPLVRPDGSALQLGDVIAGEIIQTSYSASMGKFQLAVSSAAAIATAAASAAAAAASASAAAASSASAQTYAASINGTSASSVTVGTGSKSFAASTGKQWVIGSWLVIASAANSANFMYGQVTGYNSGTGALTVNVGTTGGAGTLADWVISLSTALANTITQAQLNSAVGSDGTLSFRNRLHNGNFAVNQRSVSGSVVLGAGAYGHDRWKAGAGGCSYTFSTSGIDTIITISSGSLMQVLEASSVEGGAYALSNRGTAQARIAVNGASTSGSYATASTGSPLASATATANQAVTVEFTTGTMDRVQLEPGTAATAFDRRPPAMEMDLCQRFLPTFSAASTSGNAIIGVGQCYGVSNVIAAISFPVKPRVSPTGVTVSSAAHFFCTIAGGSGATATGITFSGATQAAVELNITVTGTPLVSGNATMFRAGSALATLLFTGAEL